MISFLTSQLNPEGTGALNPVNGFIDELRRCFQSSIRALDICSSPDAWEITDFYAGITRGYFEDAGFPIELYQV